MKNKKENKPRYTVCAQEKIPPRVKNGILEYSKVETHEVDCKTKQEANEYFDFFSSQEFVTNVAIIDNAAEMAYTEKIK